MAECEKMPMVLPIATLGMDSVLPNVSPYRFQFKQVAFTFFSAFL